MPCQTLGVSPFVTSRLWKFIFSSLICIIFTIGDSGAATTYDWRSDAPDGNWKQGAAGARWDPGGLWDNPGFGNLRFNNNTFVTMVNNVTGPYNMHQIIFGAGATTARSISGNEVRLFDDGGTDPRVENSSTASHTISFNLSGDGSAGDPLEIYTTSGNLTLSGTVDNKGSGINVFGNNGKVLTLSGVLTGSGAFTIKENSHVVFSGNHNYTGTTTLEAGSLTVASGGTLGNGSDVYIDGSSVLTAKVSVTAASIRERTSGDSGTAVVESGAVITINGAGKSVYYMSTISGAGGITMSGSGNSEIRLFAANTFSGDLVINSATVTMHGASGAIASSPRIFIGTNGTYSVASRSSTLTMPSGQDIIVMAGASANPARIQTASGIGLTAASNSRLIFRSFNNANGAPLDVAGAGSFTLASGNSVVVTNIGTALSAGSYKLISKSGTASVAGTAPATVSVMGNGLASGNTATLTITSGELFLTVTATTPTYEWTAIGGVGSRDWSTAANWNSYAEPAISNPSYINGGHTGVVSAAGERTSVLYLGTTNKPSHAANSTGQLEQASGDLIVGTSAYIGKYAGGKGTYIMSGGSLTVSNVLLIGDQGLGTMVITNSASVTVNDSAIVGSAGTGAEVPGSRLTVGGGTLTVNGTFLNVGGQNSGDAAADGLLEQFGGTITASQMKIADNTDSTGRVMIAGGTLAISGDLYVSENSLGFMNVSGASTTTVGGVTYISRYDTGSRGTLSVSGGLFSANGSLEVGREGGAPTGIVNVAGGTLTSTDIIVGRQGYGEVNISGGAVTAQTISVSFAPNGKGFISVSSGRLVLTGTDENISLRRRGAVMNVSGGAVVANGIAVGSIANHNSQNEASRLNLSGGTIFGGFDNSASIDNDFYIGAGANRTGIVHVVGGILDLSRGNNDLIIGRGSSSLGIFTMGGGTSVVAGTVQVGAPSVDADLTGNGQVYLTNGLFDIGGHFNLPLNSGSTATMTQVGGILDVDGNLTIGNAGSGGVGRYVISGGTLTNAGSLLVGHASGGSGYLEVVGGVSSIRVGNLSVAAQGHLRSTFNGTNLSPIYVAGAVTVGGTLSISNYSALQSGIYTIATSLNGSAVSGRFTTTNWLGGVTGILSYANGAVTILSPPNYEWTAGAGTDRDWSTAANWHQNTEPNALTPAYINGGFTGVVFQSGEAANQLYIGDKATGTLEQVSGALTVSDLTLGLNATNRGTFRSTGGLFTITNNVIVGDDGRGDFIMNGSSSKVVIAKDMQVSDSGANNLGSVSHNAGTVTVNNLRLGRLTATEGSYEITGGVLSVGDDIYLADGHANATGRMVIAGSAAVTVADEFYVGRSGLGILAVRSAGSLTLSGGTGHLEIGDLSGNNRANELQLDEGTINVGGDIKVGDAANTFASMVVSNGMMTAGGDLQIAFNATATGAVSITGGSIKPDDIYVGSVGIGSLFIGGGSVTADQFEVGLSAGSLGTLTVTSGVLNVEGTIFTIGSSGNGTLALSGGTINAGDATGNTDVNIGSGAASVGVVNHSGGTLKIIGPASGDDSDLVIGGSSASAIYSLSGGVLDISAGDDILINANGELKLSGTNWAATVDDDFIMSAGALSVDFVSSNIGTILVDDDITVAGTLNITNVPAYGHYTVITSLNNSAVIGTFATTNWRNGVTGLVSYANGAVVITFNGSATYEWTALAGADRKWSTAANWTGNTEPTAINTAYVNGGYTAVVAQAGERTLDLYIGSTNKPTGTFSSTGHVEQTGGDLIVGGSLLLGKYAGGEGSYTMTNGSLTASNSIIVGDQGLGSLTITNAVTVQASSLAVGNARPGAQVTGSRFTMGGGTLNVNLQITAGGGFDGTDPAGDGEIYLYGGTMSCGDTFKLGDNFYSTGRLVMAGGTLNPGNNMIVGDGVGSRGTANISGSSVVDINGYLLLGKNGSTVGNLSISGGLFKVGSYLGMAEANSSTGSLIMAGGTLLVTNGAINIGDQRDGSMIMSGGSVTARSVALAYEVRALGALTLSGGRLVSTASGQSFSLNRRSALVNISGGVLEANGIFVGTDSRNSPNPGPATINLSGGTILGGRDNDAAISNDFYIGAAPDVAGVVNISGGLLDLSRANNDLILGRGTNAMGIFTMDGGTATVAGTVRVGALVVGDGELTGDGQIFITNGLFNIGGNLNFPESIGSTAYMSQVGGRISVGGTAAIGSAGSGGVGRFVISGGTFTNAGALQIGHASSGSGYMEVVGNTSTIRVGSLTVAGQGELRSTFTGLQLSPIYAAGAITAGGTLSITNTGTFAPGTYLIATSMNQTAVSGTFATTNWLGGVTGVVSYANNRIVITFFPEIRFAPPTLSYHTMLGNASATSQTFTVTNNGPVAMTYTNVISYGGGANGWFSALPGTSTLAGAASQIHTGVVSGITNTSAGIFYATNTITGASATNSPTNLVVILVITNIPDPTLFTATADGNEMVDVAWTKVTGLDVMIIHDTAAISTEPSQSTAYVVGNTIGSGTVVYKGGGATLEHVVPPGSTNHYKYYSINNNFYSLGVSTNVTMGSYSPGEIVEPFAYTNIGTLATSGHGNGGWGWTNAWTGSNPGSFNIGANSFANQAFYPDNAANRVRINSADLSGTSKSARRNFAGFTSGKVYVGFIVNYAFGGATKYAGLSFLSGSTEEMFFGEGYGGDQKLTVGGNVSSSNLYAGIGTDHIVIGMYDFDADTAYVAAYTIGTDTVPANEPGVWHATFSDSSITRIDGIRIAAGADSGTPGDTYFDEIRVSTNWSDLFGITYISVTNFVVNSGMDVTDAQVASGVFSVEYDFVDAAGLVITNNGGTFFEPNFDIQTDIGIQILTNEIFNSLTFYNNGRNLHALDASHAGASAGAISLGTYTSRWSAVNSNGIPTINSVIRSNGTFLTFNVIDDDIDYPTNGISLSASNRAMDLIIGTTSYANGPGVDTNGVFRVTDADFASISGTNPLKFVFNVFDTNSGLQRANGGSFITNLNYDIGTNNEVGGLQDIFNTYSNGLSSADTTIPGSTSVYFHARNLTIGGSITGSCGAGWTLTGTGQVAVLMDSVTNPISVSIPDADFDRGTNDQLKIINRQLGLLVVDDDDTTGPAARLLYAGPGYTIGAINSLTATDAEMLNNAVDFSFEMTDPSGVFITNTVNPLVNATIAGNYGPIAINWDIINPSGFEFGLDRIAITNARSVAGNGSLSVTVDVFGVTEIVYTNNELGSWKLTASGQDYDFDRGSIDLGFAGTGCGTPGEDKIVSFDRAITVNSQMFFNVTDDDADVPLMGTNLVDMLLGDIALMTKSNTELIAAWNFNETNTVVSYGAGTFASNLNNSIGDNGGSIINLVTTNDSAGRDITISTVGNIGRSISFNIDMTGHKDLIMTLAAQRSGTGYDSNTISYAVNGGAPVIFQTGWTPASSFALATFSFTNITALNNATSVIIYITFGTNNATGGGNNRFDNIQFNAEITRYFEITDAQLALVNGSTPLNFSFNAYDVYSGISRGTAFTATNMSVNIDGFATNDTASYNVTRSSTETTNSGSTSVWSFVDAIDYVRRGDLYADGMSNRAIKASMADLDNDRLFDTLWASNNFFGKFRVIDDDPDAPFLVDISYGVGTLNNRPFYVATNGYSPGSSELIRGNYSRRSGTGSNSVFAVTDADLALSGSSGMEMIFAARDVYSGIGRGTSGTTNTTMSFSISGVITNNFSNFNAGLSTGSSATNVLQSNIWTFADGFFTDTMMNSMISASSNRVTVTVPDLDNDRTNDSAALHSFGVGWLEVYDDDISGPTMTLIDVVESPGGNTILATSFETSQGWPVSTAGYIISTNWNITDVYGTWFGSGAQYTSLQNKNTGTRRLGLLVNTNAPSEQWIQLPPVDNPGVLSLYAARFSGADTTIRVERADSGSWISAGEAVVTNLESVAFQNYSFNINYSGSDVTLRVVRADSAGPQVSLDDISVSSIAEWLSTNSLTFNWTAAVDDYSSVDEYRLVAPAVGTVVPASTNAGVTVSSAATSSVQSIQGQQGVITGYVFSIDNDSDRGSDRSMGNVVTVVVRIDTNPPPAVADFAGSNDIGDVDDTTSKIKLTWTPKTTEGDAAGWRQSDSAPLSPFVSYRIYYTENTGIDPDYNDTYVDVTNSIYTDLGTYNTTEVTIENLVAGYTYHLAMAAIDEAGNLGPLSDVAVVTLDIFGITYAFANEDHQTVIQWEGRDDSYFDVIYADSTGYSAAINGMWELAETVLGTQFVDEGGSDASWNNYRIPPGQMAANHMRFYRVSPVNAWIPSEGRAGAASEEVIVAHLVSLAQSNNFIGISMLPYVDTVATLMGTSRLYAGASMDVSTRISLYPASQTGDSDSNTLWLSSTDGWMNQMNVDANTNELPYPHQGFNIYVHYCPV